MVNFYTNPKIANNYSLFLQKRADFCKFEEEYLESNILKNYKVLDLGCGIGRHIIRFGNKAHMTGIDISPKMIEISQEAVKSNGVNAELIIDDVLNINNLFGSEAFDTVIMMYHTLGCIIPRKKRTLLLTRINKILKKNGTLIFHVHNRNHLKNIKFLFNTYFRNNFETGDRLIKNGELNGAVMHFFSRKEIKHDLNLSGFKIVDFVDLKFPDEKKKITGLKKYIFSGGFIVKAKKYKNDT